MVSIATAKKELNLSKEELLSLIKDKTWKSYSEKTSRISDAIFDELKKDIKETKGTDTKEEKKPKSQKVATADDVLAQDNSFLSQLWFGEAEQTPTEDTEPEDEIETDSQKDETDVLPKQEPSPAVKDRKTWQSQAPTKQDTKTPPTKQKIEITKKSDKPSDFQKFVADKTGKKDQPKAEPLSVKKKTLTKKDKKRATKQTQDEEPIKKKEINPKVSQTLKKKEKITISDNITIKEFSEKMWVSLQEVMKTLLANKIVLPVTASIDYDTACLIWQELWVEVEKEQDKISTSEIISGDIQAIINAEKDTEWLAVRSPVVTIMWHVDHGKTKLLDYLRKTDVAWWEAWWITQSIWASQITKDWNLITFIDTPWHELFTSLRARGAKITDVAIIVVAADDNVQKQTQEAINHAKDANIPILVAITKIDLPNSNIEKIKTQLADNWLIPEDWWGETTMVPISSVTWQGVDELLDMIVLQSDLLELKYNPNRNGLGVVLEADKDSKKWITASLIVMTGTMKKWDVLILGDVFGKIRRMTNWKHKDVNIARGGDPIQISWIQDLPKPWSIVEVVDSEKTARTKIQEIKRDKQEKQESRWVQNLLDQIWTWEMVQLKLIIKADSFGSLEALKYAISKINVHENVEIKIIHSDIWVINDSDINLAKAWDAVIIWFNVFASGSLSKKATNQNISIKCFDIIYELIDYVQWLATWLIKTEQQEVFVWKLQVKWIFFKKWSEMIIWGKVIEWKVVNWAYFKVFRKNISEDEDPQEPISTGKILSLKKEQENVKEVTTGHECWMKVKTSRKIQEDDVIEFYIME